MKKKFILSGINLILFIGLIYAVKNVDVQMIGPENTSVGLASINNKFHQLFTGNILLYDISEYLGYFTIACGSVFAVMGFTQMIKRRSILKVDPEIISFGAILILIFALYIIFDIVAINYRPIIMPDEAHVEASFPSSHTILGLVCMLGVSVLVDKYVLSTKLRKIFKVFSYLLAIALVSLRLLSGAHWFSDIIGGILVSLCIILFFSGIIDSLK